MKLEILEIGHPALREVAGEVSLEELATPEIQSFIDNLIETKRYRQGAGLAATQVAILKRIFVIEVDDKNPRYPYKPHIPLTVVINPTIESLSGDCFENYEGCLSVPNLRGVVSRSLEIRVKGLNRHGKPLDIIIRGISAGSFQHEIDHLDGILFPDRVQDTKTFCTWGEFKKRYEEKFVADISGIVEK